jgi:hypothetical protein
VNRAIVRLNHLRQPAHLAQPFQDTHHALTAQARIDFKCQTLAGVAVNDGQGTEASSTTQGIADEVATQRVPGHFWLAPVVCGGLTRCMLTTFLRRLERSFKPSAR